MHVLVIINDLPPPPLISIWGEGSFRMRTALRSNNQQGHCLVAFEFTGWAFAKGSCDLNGPGHDLI